ncbi:MAG: inorganic phosphate transporter [Tenuifilaceae bacterium]|nr:inorganic phosphate transporter [Tenuifilaceae bacterium]
MLVPYLLGMFLAINMGGSGTGPSFSAAYGANVIRKSLIPGLFGVMVFLGAVIAGSNTASTLGSDIINPSQLNSVLVAVVFFSVSISLLIANLAGIPQSTSQSTVCALIAPTVYFHTFNSNKIFYEIVPTWFILPIAAFIISFLLGKYIYKPLRRRGYTISAKVNNSYLLKGLLIVLSLFVAFSIGANNVANATGPLTQMTINFFDLEPGKYDRFISKFSILIIAPCFAIGSSVFGHKIMRNTGKEIVLFGRIEAAIIAFISASLLLFASLYKGIPSSLVQLNVASIIGIGIAKLGVKNIFRKTQVRNFFFMWLVSPLVAFFISLFLVFLVDRYEILYLF